MSAATLGGADADDPVVPQLDVDNGPLVLEEFCPGSDLVGVGVRVSVSVVV